SRSAVEPSAPGGQAPAGLELGEEAAAARPAPVRAERRQIVGGVDVEPEAGQPQHRGHELAATRGGEVTGEGRLAERERQGGRRPQEGAVRPDAGGRGHEHGRGGVPGLEHRAELGGGRLRHVTGDRDEGVGAPRHRGGLGGHGGDGLHASTSSTRRASATSRSWSVRSVSASTGSAPTSSTACVSVLSWRSMTSRSSQGAYARATPAAVTGKPHARIRSPAGPLTGAPPTIGLIASTTAVVSWSASRMPGTERIGPIEVIGLDGQTMTTSAVRIASRTPGAGVAVPAPAYPIPITGG